jgi:hypothetical protein
MDGKVQTTQVELKGEIVYIPQIDKTLTQENHSAEAKETGRRLYLLSQQIGNITTPNASLVNFDNANTSLTKTTVQGAISEVAEKVDDLGTSVGKIETIEDALETTKQSVENLGNDVVKKTGSSMIKGTLMVQNADNGYGSVMKNNSTSADYGTQLADVSKDGKNAKITVNALSNLLTFTDNSGEIRNIHHEGNKRFGSFKGGNASNQTFDLGSIGRLLLLYESEFFAFVTPKGALVITLDDGSIEWIDGANIYYVDGKLNYYGVDIQRFNSMGRTYYYQAI